MATTTATMIMLVAVAWPALGAPPERIGSWAEGPALAVARDGALAVVSSGRTVRTYDVSDPAAPVELGSVVLPGVAVDLEIGGGYVYAASLATGISVIDVRDPAAPRLTAGGVDLSPFGASDVTVDDAGLRAFVLTPRDGDLLVYGLQAPGQLVELWRLSPPLHSGFVATAVDGDLVYALEPGTLRIFLEAPHQASELGSAALAGSTGGVGSLAVGGGDAYVGSNFMNWEWVLETVDVADPASPVSLGTVVGAASSFGMAVDPDRGLLVSCGPDLYLTSVADPTDPRLLATYDGLGRDLVDLALDDDVVIATAGDDGAHLVDVSDPTAPAALAMIPSAGDANQVTWHGDTLLVGLGRNGVQLLDAADPTRPTGIARLPAIPEGTSRWTTHTAADGIVLQSAGVVTWPPGDQRIYGVIRSLDVTDPAAPVVLGRLELDDPVSGSALTDGLLLAATGASLLVVDVSDPTAMTVVGSLSSGALSVTPVGRDLALTFDGEGITSRLDVVGLSDPARPTVLGTISLPDRTYVADVSPGPWSTVAVAVRAEVIPGEQFLAILDLGDPAAPTILGRLDLGGEPTAVAHLGVGRVAVVDVGRWPTGSTVLVVDTSSPHDMRVVGRLHEVSRVRDLAASGSLLAMAADDAGATLWDVSALVPASQQLDRVTD